MWERIRWVDLEDDGCVAGREICGDFGGSIQVEVQRKDEESRKRRAARETKKSGRELTVRGENSKSERRKVWRRIGKRRWCNQGTEIGRRQTKRKR